MISPDNSYFNLNPKSDHNLKPSRTINSNPNGWLLNPKYYGMYSSGYKFSYTPTHNLNPIRLLENSNPMKKVRLCVLHINMTLNLTLTAGKLVFRKTHSRIQGVFPRNFTLGTSFPKLIVLHITITLNLMCLSNSHSPRGCRRTCTEFS